MRVIKGDIVGLYIIEPKLFGDSRGYFYESFSQERFSREVCDTTFVQDNQSMSKRGVLRGLHFQSPPHSQSKLVSVVHGRVLDVAVDIRQGSLTYGQHVAVELSAENHRQLFIPRGFAHGYVVMSDEAIFQYKCDSYYAPQNEGTILWNDPDLAIEWGGVDEEFILSEKDQRGVRFSEFESPFSYDVDYYE